MRSLIGGLLNSTPVSFTARGNRTVMPNMFERNNAEQHLRAMGVVGTLFSVVGLTSNATAQVDWKLYRKARSGKPEDRREVTRHAALSVWNKPNPFFTQQEFIETFQQHLDLTGEAWWVVGRNPSSTIPLELWPVRPDRMTPIPDPREFLAGYVYTSPDGEKVPLALDDVVQLRMPNPETLYRGMGPVQSLLTTLQSAKAADEWNRNFFLNSAEPGGIIEVDHTLRDDEFDSMTSRWNEQHKGIANAHRVAVIENGKWVDRSYSQRDMQFVELRGVTRDQIMETFRISKHMLGITEDVNRANAEAGEVVFARWSVVPRLERIKQALNNDLLPLFGTAATALEFDYCNPVPEDRAADNNELTAKTNAAVALVAAGFDPADVLELLELPEMNHTAPLPPAPAPAPEGRTDGQQQAQDGTPDGAPDAGA